MRTKLAPLPKFALAAVSALSLPSCGIISDRIAGPTPIVNKSPDFAPIAPSTLAQFISQSYSPCVTTTSATTIPSAAPTASGASATVPATTAAPSTTTACTTPAYSTLSDAMGAFVKNLHPSGGDPNQSSTPALQMEMRDARNSVVGQLISESNTLCGEYEQSLKEKSSNITFGLGSAAAAFGGAGAIFTNGTASIFSALSGVTSGVNAEYNKDFFQGLATSIIIPGIEKQRTALAQTMAKNMCYGITTYPLPMAIADVIRYHNACTMDKGIAATSQSVNQSSSIGLDTLQSTLQQIKNISDIYGKGGSGAAQSPPGAAPGSPPAGAAAAGNPPAATGGNPTTPPAGASGATTPPPLGSDVTLAECGALNGDGQQQATSTGSGTGTPATSGTVASTGSGTAAAARVRLQ